MGFYDDMQAVATDLLTEFKQGTVVLIKSTPGTVDPAKPWIPVAGSTTNYTLNATVRPVSKKFIDGTSIIATDSEITFAHPGVEVLPGDKFTIDGKQVVTLLVKRIPEAGTVVAWKAIVRI